MTALLFLGVFPALMAFAAAYDLTTMTIPNKLTAAVALAFFGVVMLCQPFLLVLYTYSFVTILFGVVIFTIVTKLPD